jgi:hypothetical protein
MKDARQEQNALRMGIPTLLAAAAIVIAVPVQLPPKAATCSGLMFIGDVSLRQ